MALNENVRTSCYVGSKWLMLKREWLHGLWSWGVYEDGKTKLGWVLQETEGSRWAFVTVEDDIYDDILYDFPTRQSALRALVPKDKS